MSWGQQLLVRVSQKRLSEVMHVEKAAVSHPLRMWCQAEWVGWYRVAAWVTVIRLTQTITQWQPLLSFSFLVGSGDGGHSCSWNFLGVGREWNYHDILDCLLLTCIFSFFFFVKVIVFIVAESATKMTTMSFNSQRFLSVLFYLRCFNITYFHAPIRN